MAGGFPIMRAYRPTSTPAPVPSASIPPITAFRPVFLNTRSQRAAWIQESKEWSWTLARKMNQRQRRRLEVEKEQEGTKYRAILRRQQEMQEHAQARFEKEREEQISSLACYKHVWSVSLFGLVVSGLLFLILFTDIFRDKDEGRLGKRTRCDFVPSINDGSNFAIVYWTALVVDIVSRSAGVVAVLHMARLSKALQEADAAYYARLSEYVRIGNYAGAVMACIPLSVSFQFRVTGNCKGWICLDLALATQAAMSWTLLAFSVGTAFWKSGYRGIRDQGMGILSVFSSKKGRQEVVGGRV